MIPEIWSAIDIIFSHFGSFLPFYSPTPSPPQQPIEIVFVILGHLLPFYHPNSPKNENIKKMKNKTWRYCHYTQVYQKSWSWAILFVRYGTRRMQFLFFILGYFLPFYSLNSQENENLKKLKKTPGNIITLHKCTKNHDHAILFLRYGTWHM